MKRMLLTLSSVLLMGVFTFGQLNEIGTFNVDNLPAMPDTLKPYLTDQGARSVWVAEHDLDNDGKPEILITDYTNRGRVHVLELNGNTLELVWSSPLNDVGGGSTPRWVRTGDLDGDGKYEIIFPNSESSAVDVRVRVFEWDGVNDNTFIHAIDLEANAFAAQGVGNFRTNREVASVYDFDGDGSDELMMSNRDNKVYVLGISGDVPGFGGWQIEGGVGVPKIGAGSHWHSVPADLDGDGNLEIVNHFWNYYGFFHIEPTGVDSYSYPDSGVAGNYVEYLRSWNEDAVAYMGIQVLDIDGNGDDEIAGIIYVGSSDYNYDVALVNFESDDNGLYIWDTTGNNWGIIGAELWTQAGRQSGSFWGIGAADLNANGREEILLGGSDGYTIMALEYNGSGDLLNPSSYTASVIWDGWDEDIFEKITIRDSMGVMDTLYTEAPFVSKMYAGSDINNNNKQEVVASFQSVYDTTRYVYQHWDGSAFVDDSTVFVHNPYQINVRVLESTVTGVLEDLAYKVVTPDDYKLGQNFPNPFNPSTTISFTLPIDKNISLKIYDILGNEVKALIADQDYQKGSYEVTWDGTNSFGKKVASGQYIYTLKFGNFTKSMKMTLIK